MMKLIFILVTLAIPATLLSRDVNYSYGIGLGNIFSSTYGYNGLFNELGINKKDNANIPQVEAFIMIEAPKLPNCWFGLDLASSILIPDVDFRDSLTISFPAKFQNLGLAFYYNYKINKSISINPLIKAGMTFPTMTLRNSNSPDSISVGDLLSPHNIKSNDINGMGAYLFLGLGFQYALSGNYNDDTNPEPDNANPTDLKDYRISNALTLIFEAGFLTSNVNPWKAEAYYPRNMPIFAYKGIVLNLFISFQKFY